MPQISCFTADTLSRHGILAWDGHLDPECQALWTILEQMPGIELIAACSGHETQPLSVWFTLTNWDWFPLVLHACTSRHLGYGWRCEVSMEYEQAAPVFHLQSQARGETAAKEAGQIAEALCSVLGVSLPPDVKSGAAGQEHRR